jgi:hypothetical protein
MWTAIADPTGTHPYPELSRAESWPHGAAAYWAPLTHLLLYSFGWRSTDDRLSDRVVMGRGLTELLDADLHHLPQDTRLAFMNEVWGEDELRDFADWALSDGQPVDANGRPREWRTRAGTAFDGGTDALHLSAHWSTPIDSLIGSALIPVPSAWTDSRPDPPSASILLDAYVGWAAALDAFGNALPAPASGRSWRVDVVVRRIGWLGQFRRSRSTGLWFSGGHVIHALAHDEASGMEAP